MNSVNLVGRLTRDPELRHTPSGTAVCLFSLAVDRASDKQDDGSYATGFFDIEVWDRQAENCAQYLSKGSQAAVTGRLKHHRWESQSGEKRSKVEIVANSVTFVGPKPDDDGQTTIQPTAAAWSEPADAADDIPFMATIDGVL